MDPDHTCLPIFPKIQEILAPPPGMATPLPGTPTFHPGTPPKQTGTSIWGVVYTSPVPFASRFRGDSRKNWERRQVWSRFLFFWSDYGPGELKLYSPESPVKLLLSAIRKGFPEVSIDGLSVGSEPQDPTDQHYRKGLFCLCLVLRLNFSPWATCLHHHIGNQF